MFSKYYSEPTDFKSFLNYFNQETSAVPETSVLTSSAAYDASLPPGPVIMCPESMISAFKREVIDRKPQVWYFDEDGVVL